MFHNFFSLAMLKYVTELGCYGMEESKLGVDGKDWNRIFLSLFVSSCYWFMSVYPAFCGFYFLFAAKLPNSFRCTLSVAFSSRSMQILDSI
ncbi:Serine/threonine protein phosphatase 2A 57 kDa regulatory subunit B' beta isoform [Zea mays]|jgi:hypothetical protein|uniref:Serine/threonine protein phosphatase 2A 57 kDa regulatory subunit B' beta isoform n=1 Tax=Zea mays TaxID=4577 RepID=A0A1D6GKI1_MAIZE|nr:Serine/threonine protein phosphatase 2A 57 kDa regulatory subunit B' beta isoform [Zea mays]